jgi:hypothetical protein
LPLYISNDPLHYDLYKYSPTCALFFALWAPLPDFLGLLLWTSLNILLPFFALHKIIGLNAKQKNLMALVILAESFTASLNAQSNGLVLGLLMLSIASFQKDKIAHTVIWILLAGFIKVFGWIFFLIFLIKPQHIKKGILYGLVWAAIIVLLPLLWVGWEYLLSEYRWWLLLLQNDNSQFLKLSFMGWFHAWFGVLPPKMIVLAIALMIQIIPLWFYRKHNHLTHSFIYKYAASLLVWVVLFNHMSESATYIIAVGGLAIYFSGEIHRGFSLLVVLVLVVLFTVLGPTDIYPREMRVFLVEKIQMKAFPMILFWFYCLWDLCSINRYLTKMVH